LALSETVCQTNSDCCYGLECLESCWESKCYYNQSCSDTDGGKKKDVFGIVTTIPSPVRKREDFCQNENKEVHEKFCYTYPLSADVIDKPAWQRVEDGDITIVENCDDKNTIENGIKCSWFPVVIFCDYGCSGGQCNSVPVSSALPSPKIASISPWEFEGEGSYELDSSDTYGNSGVSLKVQGAAIIKQDISEHAGKRVKLSGFIKTDDKTQAFIGYRDNNGQIERINQVGDARGWTYIEEGAIGTGIEDNYSVVLEVVGAGSVWFDDIVLEEVVEEGNFDSGVGLQSRLRSGDSEAVYTYDDLLEVLRNME